MKKSFVLLSTFIALCMNMQISLANIETIKNMAKSFPREMKPEFIDKTPIDGVYVLSNPRLAFMMDSSGQYLIKGDIFDLKTQENITDIIFQNHYSINPKQLPLAQAFKEVKGNGKRILYIFADPDCPACQALQAGLEEMDDVTIYTFPIALIRLHPTALETNKKIWCSKEPLKVWKNYLVDAVKPHNQSTSCNNPIDQNMELAKKHNVDLTPTIFNALGHRMVGIPDEEEFEEFINAKKVRLN